MYCGVGRGGGKALRGAFFEVTLPLSYLVALVREVLPNARPRLGVEDRNRSVAAPAGQQVAAGAELDLEAVVRDGDGEAGLQ